MLAKKSDVNFESIFKPVFCKNNCYQITVLDQQIFEQLTEQFEPAKDMVEAAQKGNSHAAGTSVSYLIGKITGNQNHYAIVNRTESTESSLDLSNIDTVILIENSECFTQSDNLLKHFPQLQIIKNALIVWSMGNGVTHANTYRFLSMFEKVYCCFDYDLGGLTTFKSLRQNVKSDVDYCVPENLEKKSALFVLEVEQEKLYATIDMAEQLEFNTLAKILRVKKRTMEQEALLG